MNSFAYDFCLTSLNNQYNKYNTNNIYYIDFLVLDILRFWDGVMWFSQGNVIMFQENQINAGRLLRDTVIFSFI